LEDYAHILDYLPQGLPTERGFRKEPVAYALGSTELKLFELVPKPGEIISPGDVVYIGKDMDKRDKILHVKRRVGFEELNAGSQNELPFVILEVVRENEQHYVKFFNESEAITTRYHVLELLPGLGKKTMLAILDERKKGPFKSFADIAARLPTFKHPEKVVAKRIELELADNTQKYRVFVSR
jgi:putative nucleotide binding protein